MRINEELDCQKKVAEALRASNVCDDGSFSSPKECALALSLTEGCRMQLLSKEEADWTFRVPGAFATFHAMKSRESKT